MLFSALFSPVTKIAGVFFILAETLCCPYTGNRIRPLCLAPVIVFMGTNPYVQKPMVGLYVYNGPYRIRSVVYLSVVPCPSPWFNDTTGDFYMV